MEEWMYWLWLCGLKGMWQGKMEKLFQYFHSPEEIFFATSKILQTTGIKYEDIEIIIDKEKGKKELEKNIRILKKEKIKFYYYGQENYPEKLMNINKPPYTLFVKGELPKKEKLCAIVGARACSEYGKAKAMEVAVNLAQAGIGTISGMARGIDSYGHYGSIESAGKTYAVLGCGVDICYPGENKNLYEKIAGNGGIISEYKPGTKPQGWQFPMRNRIISGLSDCVAVIEAKHKSGSLITATCALEQGKDVFALPGRTTDKLSTGCNELIRDGAGMIFDGREIIASLKGVTLDESAGIENVMTENIPEEQKRVYDFLDTTPKSLQNIVDEMESDVSKIRVILMELQLENLVFEVTNGYYVKNKNKKNKR